MTALIVATSLTRMRRALAPAGAGGELGAALARAAATAESDEVSLDKLAGPGDRIWLTAADGRVVAAQLPRRRRRRRPP